MTSINDTADDIPELSGSLGEIELILIRHGQTPGNAAHRYVGCADDQPLSQMGRQQAQEAATFDDVQRVYVSTLRRTHETASLMFPNAEQILVDGIQEMDFGVFTGRSADEMADDAAYRAWVDSLCEDACPGGESKAQFTQRVCTSLVTLLREAYARGEKRVYLVAHGGTMMAFLGHYAGDRRSYYEWIAPNCHGYDLGILLDDEGISIVSIEEL